MPDTVADVSAEIAALEQKCRDALQYPSVHRYLREKGKAFERICALLDFIGNSEGALASVSTGEKRAKVEPYFLAYGLLQLMYARQVALRAVLKTLDVAIPPGLKENSIAKPRDCVIGHPITSDDGAHVILRNTLNADGFEYASYYGSETKTGNIVEYQSLLDEHGAVMREGLMLLCRALAGIENERRREMRETPLTPTLQGIDYVVRCLAAATVEEKYEPVVEAHLQMLTNALVQFRASLAARFGEGDAAYHVDRIIEGAAMLRELYPFTDSKRRLRFEIVADGVEHNTKELIRMAHDIDQTESTELN